MPRLPAEWEPQQRVLFAFPRRAGDWGGVLKTACHDMIQAANQVLEVCPVTMIVDDQDLFANYAGHYRGDVLYAPTDDCWIRDSGPITTTDDDGKLTLIDFTFNGWGGKFDASRDNELPKWIYTSLYPELDYRSVFSVVLEGGSIETDGRGTILTTSKCLLSPGRNDYKDKREAERMLKKTLGADRVLWIDHGELLGDDTDAHIDTIARFVTPTCIAYVSPPRDQFDPHYQEFQLVEDQIKKFSDEYQLLPLPFAASLGSCLDGHRLPASYANFLISNGTLFLPTYGTDTDAEALRCFTEATDYRVVGVDCRAFVEQHGALHCLSMQIPAGSVA